VTAPAAPPEPAPAPAAPVDVGALWKRIADAAESSPRDQAMVDAFEPVSWSDGTLVVRRARGGGAGGTAIVDMLTSIAGRAAGRPVRVRVDAEPVARRVEQVAVAAPAARRPAPRDDAMASHPLVREVSELFDATIVRVEAAGSLAPGGAQPAPGAADTEDAAADVHTPGDLDV
jgi:hypothetical protein